MRNFKLFIMAIILGTSASFAIKADDKVAERNTYRYDNSFIFEESGITFAVYPDGEFDFYINNRIGNRNKNVTFNSGFDYSPYAQYDDYGAVVQVENIPVYYDYYGRVSNIGGVNVSYRNGRVRNVGNMFVYYNNRGFYDYHTGYINAYNRNYAYRPFHRLFSRPSLNLCLVNINPYRRYYTPYRYSYYTPYKLNKRRSYVNIGKTYRNNSVRRDREGIYRNDKRVTVRNNNVRSNKNVGRKTNTVVRNTRVTKPTRNTVRSSRTTSTTRNRNSNGVSRSNNQGRTVQRSSVTRTPSRTVTKRTVTTAPKRSTVTRSTASRSNAGASNRSTSSKRSTVSTTRSNRNSSARSTSTRSSRSRI